MKTIVQERINADIYRAISTVLMTKVNDKVLQSASILKTELSDDGSVCDVYVTGSLVAFQQAAGFFRSEVAKVVNLRRMPKLVFIQDKGQANADRVAVLLKQISGGNQ